MTSATGGREFWNEQAATYDDSWLTAGKRAMSERELLLLTQYAGQTAGRTALDIGFGTGRILDHYLRSTPVQRIYGIDGSESMARRTRARYVDEPRVAGLAVADLSAPLPFSTSFDVVTAIRCLKYSERWAQVIATVAQHLTPGGVFVFSMPNSRSLNRLSRAYGVPWHSTSLVQLVQACEDAGLHVLGAHGATRLSYGLYERSDVPGLGRALRTTDVLLDRVLGPVAGVREIFMAAQRAAG